MTVEQFLGSLSSLMWTTYWSVLAEQNKAQDVIINKLNAEYNLKGKKK
jgi:hypothetical protein